MFKSINIVFSNIFEHTLTEVAVFSGILSIQVVACKEPLVCSKGLVVWGLLNMKGQ